MDEPQDIADRFFARFKSELPPALSLMVWDIVARQHCKYRAYQFNQQLLDTADLGDMFSQEKGMNSRLTIANSVYNTFQHKSVYAHALVNVVWFAVVDQRVSYRFNHSRAHLEEIAELGDMFL